MTLVPLPGTTQARMAGFTHKINITSSDFTSMAAATSDILQLFPYDATPLAPSNTFPAGYAVNACGIRLVTAFDDSADADFSLTIKIGDGDLDDRYLLETQIHEAGTEIDWVLSGAASMPYAYKAADAVDATFTAGSVNLTTIDTGELDIYLGIIDLNDMADI